MTQDEFLEGFSNCPCAPDVVIYYAQGVTNNEALKKAADDLNDAQQIFESELANIGYEWG